MVNWLNALGRTRRAILAGLTGRFLRSQADRLAAIEEWEEALLRADVPVRTATELLDELRDTAKRDNRPIRAILADSLATSLTPHDAFSWQFAERPGTVLLVGVNGSGKTTTAAKLAHLAAGQGLKPLLAATDTFRAAGSEQLNVWAGRVGCDVVTGAPGGDPAAVAFDALQAAKARGADVIIVDTAGRMHTKQPLMQELKKICNAMAKCLPGAPHEIWIVLDASVGNNALAQAATFNEAVPLTGAVIAKLDGSAKAGFVLGIDGQMSLPVRFVGVGEGAEDLVPFEAEAFVQAMLGEE
ncbi:MAG: signal recognition particle-docking protein FtsY [Kiritimatiellae bacterium]|nr:signal recognition particle-docking protein FtsY [Kiritimatiellia bacterium]